jgi:putative oxidoreductase
MLFNSQERKISFGLLLMRIGLAAMLLIHALPKLIGGSPQWAQFGNTLNYLQLGLPLKVIGLTALIVESVGGLSLLSGYLFRTCCTILAVLFCFYCLNYFKINYRTLTLFSLGLTTVFLGFINTGPGRYAVAVKLEKK